LNVDPGWRVNADWVSGQPLTPAAMFPPSGSTNAGLGRSVSSFATSSTWSGCIGGTGAGADNNVPLGPSPGPGGFPSGGTASLRLWVSNQSAWPSSSWPTGYNAIIFAGTANGANAGPVMTVVWHYPPPPPPLVYPPTSPGIHTLTPSFSVSGVADPDGDPVYYAYFVNTDLGTWGYGWTASTTSAPIPSGYLSWNQTYSWQACSWDEVDPFTLYQCTALSGFSTLNRPPPIPPLSSPGPNAWAATATPPLIVSAVTDPDNDPVSYQYEIRTGPDGSGSLVQPLSPWTGTSWTPAALADGTYYGRAQAEDNFGFPSGWSVHSNQFWVDIPRLPHRCPHRCPRPRPGSPRRRFPSPGPTPNLSRWGTRTHSTTPLARCPPRRLPPTPP
jgi:hypothetical protein